MPQTGIVKAMQDTSSVPVMTGHRRRQHPRTSAKPTIIGAQEIGSTRLGSFMRPGDSVPDIADVFPPDVVATAQKFGHLPVFMPEGVTLRCFHRHFGHSAARPFSTHHIFSPDCHARIETYGFFTHCHPSSRWNLVHPQLLPGPGSGPYDQVPHIVEHLRRMFQEDMPPSVARDIAEYNSEFPSIRDDSEKEGKRAQCLRRLMKLGVVRHYLPSPADLVLLLLVFSELGIDNPLKNRRVMTNHLVHSERGGMVTVGPFVECHDSFSSDAEIDITWARSQREDKLTSLGLLFFWHGSPANCRCTNHC